MDRSLQGLPPITKSNGPQAQIYWRNNDMFTQMVDPLSATHTTHLLLSDVLDCSSVDDLLVLHTRNLQRKTVFAVREHILHYHNKQIFSTLIASGSISDAT